MSADTDRSQVLTLYSLCFAVLFPVALHCDTPGASASRGRACRDQSDWLAVVSDERKECFPSRSTVEVFADSSPAFWPSHRSSSHVFAVPRYVHIEPFAPLDGPVVPVGQLVFGWGAVLLHDEAR